MSGYDYSLSRVATQAVLACPRAGQRRMENILERLAREPFAEPDFTEAGESGRRYAVRMFGDTIVTYWVDHAVKEIKVVRIEFVEAGM